MQILSLVASFVVFLMWAHAVFRVLFAMRHRMVERTGKRFPGPFDTLREWGYWLREPAYKAERRRLLFMTLSVFVLSMLIPLSLASP
ncbi:MAG: hypothetical protein HKN30_02250 [Sulfitobacter sp.]|nr:hypothetical protein [Sulfitobacter sp.]